MNDKKDFGQELLAEIKMKKISPTPKWRFILKNILIWIVGILSLCLGSVATSLIMHMLRYNDFDAFDRVGPRQFEMIFFAIPFFWLVCLAIFTVLVFYNIKKTKNGYRYPAFAIVVGSILSSVVLGGIFFRIGLGRLVDDVASKNAPFYDKVINPRMGFWDMADEGRLAGLVAEKKTDKKIIVVSKETEWNVVLSENIDAKDFDIIEVGKPARFLGEKKSENEFIADKILPMEAGREFFSRMEGRRMMQPRPETLFEMKSLFEKYPELKKSFSDDLLKNKDIIRNKIRKNPREIEVFKLLGVDREIIEQLE